jgi:hypothetical protein
VYVRRVFAGGGGGPPEIDHARREAIRETVIAYLESEECYSELGPISFRYKEDCWRIDVVVRDGCDEDARDIGARVSAMLQDHFNVAVAVWCFDRGGREVGHFLP